MWKSILTCAVAATFTNHAIGYELYSDATTQFELESTFKAGLYGGNQIDTHLSSNRSELSFDGKKRLSRHLEALSNLTFSIEDSFNHDDEIIINEAYLGIRSRKIGTLTLGLQPRLIEKAFELTSPGITFEQDLGFELMNINETAHSVSYEVNLTPIKPEDFGTGTVFLNLETNENSITGENVQAGFDYSFLNLKARTTYLKALDSNRYSLSLSVKNGTYFDGSYMAGTISINEDLHHSRNGRLIEESMSYSIMAAHSVGSANYAFSFEMIRALDDELDPLYRNATAASSLKLQSEYKISEDFIIYGGYSFDLNGDLGYHTDDKHDEWTIGGKLNI
ncbi:hypothetical protein ACP3V3_02450 [Vibrio sp. PNB22_3_1]